MNQAHSATETKPLAGLKVIEIGAAMAGPYAGLMLADYGAEVLKVEPVEDGDFARTWAPFFPGRMSFYFAAANRNKKSLALDLKSPEGLKIARQLLAEADVLVTNYRVGALDRLGLSYEEVAELNPRLIYCNISGFGIHGPRARQPANDMFMQAFSGGMSLTGEPDGDPVRMGISVADIGCGMFAAFGVLAALEQRHRTGKGQRVDTSLLEGQVAMLSYHFTRYFVDGKSPWRTGSSAGAGLPYGAFPTADDDIVIATFNDKMFQRFCDAIGQSEWGTDDRYNTHEKRILNRTELLEKIRSVLRTAPAAHWLEQMEKHEVPCSPVHTIAQVVDNEQVKACDMIIDVPSDDFGLLRMAGYPVKMSGITPDGTTPPPKFGEHTHAVLQHLGYTDTQIAELAGKKVVAGQA